VTPTFDWTISLGAVVNIVMLAGTVLVAGWKLLRSMDQRINHLYRELDKRIGNGDDAPISVRLSVLESRMNDLWHWWTNDLERRRRPP